MPNKTNNSPLYNYLLAVVLIAFAALKFNDLFLPYFWDELGVYSQCAVYQYHHGISLMPASLPDYISRGHPLFLTVMNASIMKFFGTAVYVPHSLHLFIAILLLLAVYKYTTRYFNRLTGLVAVVILAAQPIFITQSIFLLPEVLLSLLMFYSLVSYFEKKYILFGLFASLAILTKESAVVLPVVVFSYSVLRWLVTRTGNDAFNPLNLLATFMPYIFFGGFLLIQKAQMGWYFFPYHINNTGFNVEQTWEKFADFFHFAFHRQGRFWWNSIFFTGAILALARNQLTKETLRSNILVLFIIFISGFLVFSSLSFFMERYVVVVIVFSSVIVAVAVVNVLQNKILIAICTALLAITALSHFESDKFNYDNDMSYRKEVQNLQAIVDSCATLSKGEELVYGNFPAYFALNFREGGYLKPDKPIKATMNLVDSVKYFITTSPGDNIRQDARFRDSLIVEIKTDYAESRIYYLHSK
ncbi:MAG TPA: glycosyltransferase family 39 protein [Chitinophagales bacterium]|nr:glycosyltransferase family 39 protein [Chitinophagales bacterium]